MTPALEPQLLIDPSRLENALVEGMLHLDTGSVPAAGRKSGKIGARPAKAANAREARIAQRARTIAGKNRAEIIRQAIRGILLGLHSEEPPREQDPTTLELFRMLAPKIEARRLQDSEDRIDKLAEVLADADPVRPVRVAIEADNAVARNRFIDQFECLNSEQVAALAGHEARNRSASASRWKREQRIFGISRGRQELYPAFQFRDGRPRPIIRELLREMPKGLSAWDVAFWFVSSHRWLDGAVPVKLLDQPDRLLEALAHERDAVVG